MKRILFLTPHVPSEMSGGAKFTKSLLRELGEKNSIDLVYFKYTRENCMDEMQGVRVIKICSNTTMKKFFRCISCLIFHPIFSVRYSWNLIRFLKKIDSDLYDLIFLDHSQMFVYARFFKHNRVVLMAHDVMNERYSRSFVLEKKWVFWSERRLMRQKNVERIFTFSNKDVDIIRNYYNLFNVKATNFFIDDSIRKLLSCFVSSYFVFFGNWSRKDNLSGLMWFYEDVFPLVKDEIKIKIIGGGMPDSAKEIIGKKDSNVEFLGFIEDPYYIITSAKAVLAPIFSGAGVKVKVVESLACGTPVIGTNMAFEGIEIEHPFFVTKRNTAKEFCDALFNYSPSEKERFEFKQKFVAEYQSHNSLVVYINEM